MKTKILLLVLAMANLTSSLFSQKWIVQHSGLNASNNPNLVFSPVNPNVCWGIQTEPINPKIVRTTNGGDNWSTLSLNGISGFYAQSIAAISADTAWITLDDPSGVKQGGIYKTTNGGADWIRQETAFPGTGSHPKSICFFDSMHGLCHGDPKNGYWEIYTTSDGGTNWTRVPSANIPAPTSGDFSFGLVKKNVGNSYWFSTLNRSAYRTTDRGLTWSVVRNLPTTGGAGNDLAFRDEMNGLAICYFGEHINKLSATNDGGNTWTLLNTAPVFPSAYFFEYVPGTTGTYVMISSSNIGAPEPTVPGSAYTTDNGQSWTVIDNLPHWIPSFTTGNVGWSAGDGDIIYKWVTDTHTDIVPAGSTVKKLSSNQYQFLEGPVWYNDSVLLFVDDGVVGNGPDIYKYDPVAKQFSNWPSNSTHCVGLTCDIYGNLIGASSNIIMMNKAGQLIKTLASGYNGKPFNNPNDLIADNKGGVYFTDPDFFVTTPPQDKTAVYYIDPAGNVTRVIEELVKPNGLVLSPDGTKLYVVETKNKFVYSWDVASDGSVSGKSSLAELQTGVDSYADGMAIDSIGNIYIAGDKGIQVFSPQGVALTTIVVPEQPSNCDFGGSDFKTLYITAHSNLYSIDLNYPGYAVSRNLPTLGINQIPEKPMIGLYPNPVTDMLHVKLNEGIKVKAIEILNTVGKMESISLKSLAGTDVEINTQNLKPGIYLLRIDSDAGIVSGKFIKN
jgi:sugar lactone lactonase YvrE/photosystem II stability/assembly factor-like uncharacterized protein